MPGLKYIKLTDASSGGMPNVFSIADDILIAGVNEQGKDHDATLDKLLRVCRQAGL